MLALEGAANEANLRESIKVDHPVARLLLQWIDMDDAEHGKMVVRMLAMSKRLGGNERRGSPGALWALSPSQIITGEVIPGSQFGVDEIRPRGQVRWGRGCDPGE
jgi:hypothetical protein